MIRIDFNELNFQSQRARDLVIGEGSKPLGYLREEWKGTSFEKYLPTASDYLPPDKVRNPDDVRNFIQSLGSSSNAKMVRLCLPPSGSYGGDFVGCVDVLPSKPAYDKWMLEKVINHSLYEYANEHFSKTGVEPNDFIRWESGADFNWDVGLLVQDYYGLSVGSLVEHPHKEDSYAIEMINMQNTVASRSQAVLEKDSDKFVFKRCQAPALTKFFLETVDVYKAIKDSGLVPEDYTFQLEFGKTKEGIKIYQVRLFRKMQERASFETSELTDLQGTTNFKTYDLFSYGITPKEGIEIPVTYLNDAGVNALNQSENAGYIYGYPYGRDIHESPPLSVRPDNVTFYHAKNDRNFLEHGHYRFGARSDVFMVCAGGAESYPSENLHGSLPKVKNVRVYSNGIKGAVLVPN